MTFFDAHSHLHFPEFAGIGAEPPRGVCACLSSASFADMQILASVKKRLGPKIFAAFGVHPKFAGEFDSQKLAQFLPYADAVGEIGYDKNSEFSAEEQRRVFEAQLKLAAARNLPAIIHAVGHFDFLEKSLKECGAKKFLIHAAKMPKELVKIFEGMGGYFSFGLRELESAKGRACLLAASRDKILLETDKDSRADILEKTYAAAAEILNVEVFALQKTIETNFAKFFK
ncbi:MAG: TatD family hydrolase [Opitutales bacterium]|nr:TatD family hydrolase [Opitutales bacterium]